MQESIIHHERKGDDGDDLDAFRGDSALVSFATCCMRVTSFGGVKVLRFAKVTNGPTPAPIYFELGSGGRPVVVDAPVVKSKAKGDRTREGVAAALRELGCPASADEVRRQIGAKASTESTVKRHLHALVEAGEASEAGERKKGRSRVKLWLGLPPDPVHAVHPVQNEDAQRRTR